MSSMLKKYKENVKQNKLEFDREMYKNVYGSFGIAYYRCYSVQHNAEENEKMKKHLKDIWKRMCKNRVFLPFLNDKDFVSKMMKAYGIENFPYGNMAIVVGRNNSLFAPCYWDKENNKVQIIPLREDGNITPTLLYGKPTVIVKDDKNKPSDA